MRDLRIRWFVIVSILICSAYNIWPTYKYYFTNSSDNDILTTDELLSLKNKSINLGLDLQGGMYVLLEVNVPELVLKVANKKSEQLIDLINDAKELLKRIKDEGLKDMRWAAYIRADNLDSELAKLMVET